MSFEEWIIVNEWGQQKIKMFVACVYAPIVMQNVNLTFGAQLNIVKGNTILCFTHTHQMEAIRGRLCVRRMRCLKFSKSGHFQRSRVTWGSVSAPWQSTLFQTIIDDDGRKERSKTETITVIRDRTKMIVNCSGKPEIKLESRLAKFIVFVI